MPHLGSEMTAAIKPWRDARGDHRQLFISRIKTSEGAIA